ncbi:uncharacterized protein LOC143447328 isoform X2 [Clavelina lepadiformis]|uniref:uncharacterized protein LOC143447328 isoform X2 n=1 Tax=Clavelina lepadiformis TaxID=159417 RepID=UPI0040434726
MNVMRDQIRVESSLSRSSLPLPTKKLKTFLNNTIFLSVALVSSAKLRVLYSMECILKQKVIISKSVKTTRPDVKDRRTKEEQLGVRYSHLKHVYSRINKEKFEMSCCLSPLFAKKSKRSRRKAKKNLTHNDGNPVHESITALNDAAGVPAEQQYNPGLNYIPRQVEPDAQSENENGNFERMLEADQRNADKPEAQIPTSHTTANNANIFEFQNCKIGQVGNNNSSTSYHIKNYVYATPNTQFGEHSPWMNTFPDNHAKSDSSLLASIEQSCILDLKNDVEDSSGALSGQNQTTTSDDNSSSFTHNLNKERSFSSTWFWRIFGYGPPTEDGPEFIEMRNL